MNASRIVLRRVCACLLAAYAGQTAAQQTYPIRPIRFIIPFPPGGSTDPVGRYVASKLTDRLGQQMIVDNRPGGNTVIGVEAASRATPDGYTLLWVGATQFSIPSLIPNLPFSLTRDFAGVGTIGKSRVVLVVHPSVPAQTVQELIALAKAKAGDIKFGSSGFGSNPHLHGELFRLTTGIDIRHIPYKGSGPLSNDLLGGRVEMAFQVPITVISFINGGKLRALALTGEQRLAPLPQVPTFNEVGLQNFGMRGITGIVAPAKTPRPVLDKLSRELAAVMTSPDAADYMAKQGAEPFINDAAQTDVILREEVSRYAKLIKDAGIKFQP